MYQVLYKFVYCICIYILYVYTSYLLTRVMSDMFLFVYLWFPGLVRICSPSSSDRLRQQSMAWISGTIGRKRPRRRCHTPSKFNMDLHFIYIYIPRTQMTLVLIRKGLVLGGWPSKIEVVWVPDIRIHIFTYYTHFFCLGIHSNHAELMGLKGFSHDKNPGCWQYIEDIYYPVLYIRIGLQ